MNIPNLLSVLRLLLVPLFVYVFLTDGNCTQAGIILAVSGLTDCLDGYIARRWNKITNAGKILDPLADKLTQATVVFCIAYKGMALVWIAFAFIIIKELLMLFGGIKIYKNKDVVVSSHWYGKIATVVFYIGFFILVCLYETLNIYTRYAIVGVSLSISLLALVAYARHFFQLQIKNF